MEELRSQAELPSPLPSERSFGFLFTAVFGLASGYGAYAGWTTTRIGVLAVLAAAMFVAALLAPSWLRPLNRAWFALGQLMGRIVSPLVLGLMFFLLLAPVAMVTRLFGRDELRLRKRDASTYWLERDPPGPVPDSFKNQF